MNKLEGGMILNLLIYMLTLNTNLSAQQKNIDNITVENAAVYYLKTFELMHYPKAGEAVKK